jgi:PAS domain S-box-containing protein
LAETEELSAQADGQVGTPVAITGLRVLVVDDMAANRQLLKVFLKRLGCEVVLAENGADGVAMFQREEPDLVLMDVMMPVMDGYKATRRIKELSGNRWTPVVFVSALDKEEHLVAGLAAGADDYLAKPVNFTVLDAKLRSLARTLALQRRLEETRRYHESVTDNVGDCVVTIDERGVILSANAVVQIVFGYLPEELVGRNVAMLMPEPHRSAHDGYVRSYVRGGVPKVIGLPHRHLEGLRKDGSVFPVELTVTEMRFEDSRVFVGIMRDVSERVAADEKLRQHAATLQRLNDERVAESQLAAGVMQRLMARAGLSDPRLHHWSAPATDFSGDVIAAARCPEGRLCMLMADATGHGLPAAISVLPVLTSFYALVEQGFPIGFIAYDLNRQLLDFMPTGRFVAASLLCFDESTQVTQLWLGGMPDLLIVEADGKTCRRLAPDHLALGIIEFDEEMAGIKTIACDPGSQLVVVSDGVVEATSPQGEVFGFDRLAAALCSAPRGARLDAVLQALTTHLGTAELHDDTSILLLDC